MVAMGLNNKMISQQVVKKQIETKINENFKVLLLPVNLQAKAN